MQRPTTETWLSSCVINGEEDIKRVHVLQVYYWLELEQQKITPPLRKGINYKMLAIIVVVS